MIAVLTPDSRHPYIISRHAPAKVNLMLHVVGRMADGYHQLQSLVAFSPMGDRVTVEKSDALRVTADGPFAKQLPLSANNIIAIAARWLAETYPTIDLAYIRLTKNLPVSSEEQNRLILASGALGADVPMCLAHQFGRGCLMWINGSGRESLPISLDHQVPGVMVLVNPGRPISTAAIFQQICPPYTFPQACPNFTITKILTYLKAQKNDLMKPAMYQEPVIDEIIKILQTSLGCALARMSGSGATCFGLFGNVEEAMSSLAHIKKHQPQAWGIIVP